MRRSGARGLRGALLAAAAALGVCLLGADRCAAPSSTPPPAPRPSAADPGPRVVLPSGAVIAVEVALTEAEKAQGLMFRESMPRNAGMIFPFDTIEIRPFWMKNCHFPLDIVHLKKDGTVVDVLANVPPCAADPCPTYPPAVKSDTILELNAGEAARNGVVRGAKVVFREIPGR